MAVYALMSASGSPGVTTTVLGLGMAWPRPVVIVEADPTAGSGILAGFFRGTIEPTGGLVELMVAHRQGMLADQLASALLSIVDGKVQVLPGVRTQAQAAGLPDVWPALLAALRDLEDSGTDVLVDVGRIGLASWPEPLVIGADAALLVTGSSLRAAAAARSWSVELQERRPAGIGLLVVGPDRPYAPREIGRVIGWPLVGYIEWDGKAAQIYSDGEPPSRSFAKSGYLRSLRATIESMRALASRSLAPEAIAVGGSR